MKRSGRYLIEKEASFKALFSSLAGRGCPRAGGDSCQKKTARPGRGVTASASAPRGSSVTLAGFEDQRTKSLDDEEGELEM